MALNLYDTVVRGQQTGFLAFIHTIFALLQKLRPIFLTLTPFLLLNYLKCVDDIRSVDNFEKGSLHSFAKTYFFLHFGRQIA